MCCGSIVGTSTSTPDGTCVPNPHDVLSIALAKSENPPICVIFKAGAFTSAAGFLLAPRGGEGIKGGSPEYPSLCLAGECIQFRPPPPWLSARGDGLKRVDLVCVCVCVY